LSQRAGRRRIAYRRLWAVAAKAATLGPRGWWLLVRAHVSLLRAFSLVRTVPRGELVRELAHSAEGSEAARPADRARVEAIGLAVNRAARLNWRRPRCLVRAIALQRMLLSEGVHGSRIRVGVRMARRGFEAHAWVEWNDVAIGEDPAYVASFELLSELQPDQVPLSWAAPALAP
jgi:Transglutaminase-like superfamily